MINKRAAIELSMTTIIVVVLSLALLIMGFILVRNIMCGAITFSNSINEKTANEIDKLFETSAGEVNCYGGGAEAIAFEQGKANNVRCRINAKEEREYRIKIVDITAPGGELEDNVLKQWIKTDLWEEKVTTEDTETVFKVGRIDVPEDSPIIQLAIKIEAEKKIGTDWKTASGSKDLDFEIKKENVILLC